MITRPGSLSESVAAEGCPPDLTQLLDFPALKTLLDDFHRLTQAVVAILDLRGRVLLAVGWQDVCTQFHRVNPATEKYCIESDLFLAGNVKAGDFVAYQCRNGLWDVVTPLVIAGIHLGNIYTGQFFYDDEVVDSQVFADAADAHGFDREAYLAAVARVPRLSRDRVQATMQFLVHFTALVADQGINAWRAKRASTELSQGLEVLRKAQEAHQHLFTSALHGIVYQDAQGAIVSANPAAERILGLSLDQMQGRTSIDPRWRSIHADGSPFPGETHPAMEALRSGRAVQGAVMGVFNPETGHTTWIEVSAVPFFHPGEDRPFQVCATFQDISLRKGLDEARGFLATADWVRTGEDFFHALARFLARHLEMDYVCIDRLAGDALSAETLAICFDGRFDPNVEYTLKETPCGEVVGKAVCSFPSGVRHRFPQDAVLQEMGAESYVGVTLWGSTGQPIGLIAVIGRQPLADLRLAESILPLVGQRAAAELELRQKEDERRLSEARLEQAFGCSPIGMALVALDGHFLRVNPVFCAIVGWGEADLLATGFQAITHPEDLGADVHFVEDMIAGRLQTYRMDKRYLRKDGSEVWTDLSVSMVRDPAGAPLHFLSQIQDITVARRAQAALAASEERFRTVFEASPDAVLIREVGGCFLEANRVALERYGYTREELLTMSPEDLVPPELRPEIPARIAACLQTGEPAEWVHQRKDGTRIPVELLLRPFTLRGRSCIYASARDISERRSAEAQRQHLEAQLHQAQKLESLGSLAGGVAHDINNVLGAIQALAEVNQHRTEPGTPVRRDMDTMIRACERGGRLVKGLLGFARQELSEARVLDLNGVVQEVATLLGRTTLQKVTLQVDLDPTGCFVLGESAALTHAVMNLCVNAVDAMPGGGVLTLRTLHRGERVVLEVEDAGHGMAQEVLSRALEPFFTTKPQGKGTGLGLPIVYGTVKAHQGILELASEPGRGTLVRIQLPARQAVPQGSALLPPGAPGDSPRALDLLVVDDDELIRVAMETLLESLGHRVTVVSGGEEALAALEGGLHPDAVILDMNMPGLDGAATLVRLRRLDPSLPVLLASGGADPRVQQVAATHPGVRLLPKPFSAAQVWTELHDLVPGARKG